MADDDEVNIAPQGGPPTNKARLTLRLYEGKEDAAAAQDFVMKVDSYKAVARLTDAETAQAVSFAMTQGSPADKWLRNLMKTDPAVARSWDTLALRMLDRFAPTATASERADATDHCKQAKGETVRCFLDTCIEVKLMLDRNIAEEKKTGENADDYKEGFDAAVLELFLKGLREDGGLKSHVNGAFHCDLLHDYVIAAIRYERHVTKQAKVVIAALAEDGEQEDDDDEEVEVANLKATKKKKSGGQNTKNGGGNGNPRGKKSGGRGGGNNGGGANKPKPRCWTCQSEDHLNYQCPDKKRGGGRGQGNGNGQHAQAGGGGGGGPAMEAAMLALGHLMLRNQPQGANVEAMELRHNPPPPQYHQNSGHSGFW